MESSCMQESAATNDATEAVAEERKSLPIVGKLPRRDPLLDRPTQRTIESPRLPIFQNSIFRCCSPGAAVCERLSMVDAVTALGEEENNASLPCPPTITPRRREQTSIPVHYDFNAPEAEPGKAVSTSDIKSLAEAMAEGPIIQRIMAGGHLLQREGPHIGAMAAEVEGDLEEALPHFRSVLSFSEASFGKLHPETLGTIYNLAIVLEAMGQADEAEELFRRELEGCVQMLGRGHTAVGASVHNLIRFLEKTGKRQEARHIESQFRAQEVAAVTQVPLCPS